jgi:hypothetical protein
LSRNAVYVLETAADGGNPTIDTAQRLASALGVDFGWLTTGAGSPPANDASRATGTHPRVASVKPKRRAKGAA